MKVVLNKKSTKKIILYIVGLYLYMSDFLFQFLKKHALKNIEIHVMCIFTKNITTQREKNGISISSK